MRTILDKGYSKTWGRGSAPSDYSAHLARLLVLGGVLCAGILLNYLSAGRPYFIFLTICGVVMVAFSLVIGSRARWFSSRFVVPLFDLAWIMFAMYLTNGLQSYLLPLLYILVATAAIRGDRWEIGTTLAGAMTGIFVLAAAAARHDSDSMALAAAQAALLAAGALAVRLTLAADSHEVRSYDTTERLYETLLNTTSDAVFSLEPEQWVIRDANRSAAEQFGQGQTRQELIGQRLTEVINFNDTSFVQTCRARLGAEGQVEEAVTYAHTADGRQLGLTFNLTPTVDEEQIAFIQAVVTVEAEAQTVVNKTRPLPSNDFITHYIPSLTHELNNHLGAIRLSAELAETTGHIPDFKQMQDQVDHCQEVLQTVVLQMLRAAAPVVTPTEIPTSPLKRVIEQALLLTRPQVLTGSVQLQVRMADELPDVQGFTYELQEALVRIIIQQAETLGDQEPPRTLSLAVQVGDRDADISITDVGPGLSAAALATINGRQMLTSAPEDRMWEVVREGICRFGGTIQAENGLHGGARFRITLPLAKGQ